VAALDDADPAGALLGEAFERVVYREELLQGYVGLGGVAGEGEADVLAAALVGALLPGVVHQHAAHGRGGGAEEVGAALPADVLVADEAEVGLVDEPRRVEGVAGALVAQPGARHLAELRVDRREEPVEGGAVAPFEVLEQARDVGRGHGGRGENGEVRIKHHRVLGKGTTGPSWGVEAPRGAAASAPSPDPIPP